MTRRRGAAASAQDGGAHLAPCSLSLSLPLEFVALSSRSVSLSVSLTPSPVSPHQARRRYRNIKLCFEPNLFDLHFCTCGDRVRFRRYLNCVHGRRPFKRRNGRCAAQPYSSNLKPSRKEGEPIQFVEEVGLVGGRGHTRVFPPPGVTGSCIPCFRLNHMPATY